MAVDTFELKKEYWILGLPGLLMFLMVCMSSTKQSANLLARELRCWSAMPVKFSGVWGEGELVCGDVFRHLGIEHFSSLVCYGMLMITKLTLFFPEIDLIVESWCVVLVHAWCGCYILCVLLRYLCSPLTLISQHFYASRCTCCLLSHCIFLWATCPSSGTVLHFSLSGECCV